MSLKSLWIDVCREALAPRALFIAGACAAFAGSAAYGQLVELVSPNAEATGKFGVAVAGSRDFTGDGRGDMMVGAPDEDASGMTNSGRVYLFNGWSGEPVRTLVSPNPEDSGAFGTAVAGVRDVNGDGIAEIVVGARSEDGGNVANAGRVYLFNGATGAVLQIISSPNAIINGNFGAAVDGVPDVNGDGKGDIVVGAPNETSNTVTNAGRAYIFSGADGSLLFQLNTAHATSFSNFGGVVAGSPDFSGDGKGDVIVGAQREPGGGTAIGLAYAFNGATGALIREIPSPVAEENGFFGAAVAAVEDINNDGLGDFIVGAFNQSSSMIPGAGRAYLYDGAFGAPIQVFESPNPESNGAFGKAVAVAWANSHAGTTSVVIGATGEDAGASNSGRVYRMSLAGALLETINSPHPATNGRFGAAVADVPESTHDGVDEMAYGASAEFADPAGAGRAYLRLLGPLGFTPTPTPDGSPTVPPTESPSFTPSLTPSPSPSFTPSPTDSPSPTESPAETVTPSATPTATAQPANQKELRSPAEQETTYFGSAVGGVPDADGDGRGDVIVGTIFQMRAYLFSGATGQALFTFSPPNPNLHSGYYGEAVAGVPDVDGDGRGDVIIGSAQEDDPVGNPYGRVFVHSGATGALLQALIPPPEDDVYFGSFGAAVAGIRDIDNDGRGDILVGARGFANAYSGHAFAYSGATGKLLFELHPGTHSTHLLGFWITSCPDIDLDGRDEILVTQLSSNDGNVNVFSGADGHWMRAVAIGSEYGNGVAGLPDITGDGRGDIAAGDANLETVLVFNGFTGELVHTIHAPDPAISYQFTSSFGGSIAGLRDLNGDGRGEILIGSPADHYIHEATPTSIGRAYVYDGRTGTELFHLESPIPEIDSQQGNAFGQRVAVIPGTSAPGKLGLIVGAPNSSPPPSPFNAGRVHIFDIPLPNSVQVLNRLLGIAPDPGPDANSDNAVDIADLLSLLQGP